MENQELPEFRWTSFWNWFLKQEPDASYQICTFGDNRLPYQWEDNLGFVVVTKLTMHGETHLRYEPVHIREHAGEEKQRQGEQKAKEAIRKQARRLEQDISDQITLSDINRAIIRCLFQNLLSFE